MAVPHIGSRRFFWNIEANVGLGSPNKPDDVQLVQMGYFALAQTGRNTAEEKALYSAIVPGAPYAGRADELLTRAIKLHQSVRGGTQDGHVSPITGSTGSYDGQHSFMLIPLVNATRDLMPNDFPRIDKHPRCPPDLRAAVRRAI